MQNSATESNRAGPHLDGSVSLAHFIYHKLKMASEVPVALSLILL